MEEKHSIYFRQALQKFSKAKKDREDAKKNYFEKSRSRENHDVYLACESAMEKEMAEMIKLGAETVNYDGNIMVEIDGDVYDTTMQKLKKYLSAEEIDMIFGEIMEEGKLPDEERDTGSEDEKSGFEDVYDEKEPAVSFRAENTESFPEKETFIPEETMEEGLYKRPPQKEPFRASDLMDVAQQAAQMVASPFSYIMRMQNPFIGQYPAMSGYLRTGDENEDIKNLERKIIITEQEKNWAKDDLAQMKAKNDQIKKELQGRIEKVREENSELRRRMEEYKGLDKIKEERDQQLAVMEQEKNSLLEKIKESHKEQLADYTGKLEKMSSELDLKERELSGKKKELESKAQELAKAKDANTRLEEQIQSLKKQHETYQEKNSKTAENAKKINEQEQKLKEANRKVEKLEQQIKNEQGRAEDRQKEIDRLKKEIERLKQMERQNPGEEEIKKLRQHVSELDEDRKEMEKLAYYDSRTGIPNANAFNRDAKTILAEESMMARIGVNGFQEAYAQYGFQSAVKMTAIVGKVLAEEFPEGLYKVTDDSFTVVGKNYETIRKKLEVVEKKLLGEGVEIYYGLSDAGARTRKELLATADKDMWQMYQAINGIETATESVSQPEAEEHNNKDNHQETVGDDDFESFLDLD